MKKIKHVFFLSLLAIVVLTSCNKYLSIEKRKYRDGYHVEWFSSVKNIQHYTVGKCQKRLPIISSLEIKRNISDPIVNTGNTAKNIVIEKQELKISRPLSPKIFPSKLKKIVSLSHKSAEEGGHAMYVFIGLILLSGFILTILYSSALWIVLAGLIALIIALLSVVGSTPAQKTSNKEETMEEMFAVKKKIPFIAFVAFVLALATILSYLFFYGPITIFVSILGAVFSADAIYQIKKDRAHKEGMGISIFGFVISIASLLFLAYLLFTFLFV